MKVAELMWTKLETVGPDDTVGEAVGILLVGVISQSDVARGVATARI